MKRMLCILAALLCAALAGCSGTPTPAEAVPAGPIATADLALTVGDTAYAVRGDAADLLAALGGGYAASEAVSCLYEGFDKSFIYEDRGVEIYTHPEGETDIIDEILVRGEGYATARGIKAGATLKEVRAVYGEGKLEAATLTYVSGDDPDDLAQPRVYFILEDDRVASFSLYHPSNISGE